MTDVLVPPAMMADKLRPLIKGHGTIAGTEFIPLHVATVTTIILLLDQASASACPEPVEGMRLPADVRRLVIAAREVLDDAGAYNGLHAELLAAVEAFAARVPYVDQPDDADFDLVDAGDGMSKFVALPGYQRSNENLFLRLLLIGGHAVTEDEIAAWTDEQAVEADIWAVSTHLNASDNDDIVVPPWPTFIAKEDRHEGRHMITGEPL